MDRISFIMYVRFGLCVVLLHVKCLPCLHCIFGVCQYSIVNKNSNQSWNFFDCLFILLFHSKWGSFKMPFVRQHSIFYLYHISFSFLFERKNSVSNIGTCAFTQNALQQTNGECQLRYWARYAAKFEMKMLKYTKILHVNIFHVKTNFLRFYLYLWASIAGEETFIVVSIEAGMCNVNSEKRNEKNGSFHFVNDVSMVF